METDETGKTGETGEEKGKGDMEKASTTEIRQQAKHAVKILFIDDKTLVLQTVQKLLENTSVETGLCDDAFSGLCELTRRVPQAIFIDANMSHLNGFQFCALIKACKNYQHVHTIIVLEQPEPLLEAKAIATGAFAVLVKPFGKDELLNLLQERGAQAA